MQNSPERTSYRFILVLLLVVLLSVAYLSNGFSSQARLSQSFRNAHARPAGDQTSNTAARTAAIAVDSYGDAYVTGIAGSNFPVTPSAFQTTSLSGDAFVAKPNATGTGTALLYSTYLGGSGYDFGKGIAIDSTGNAYVTGSAGGNFPATAGAYQATYSGLNFNEPFVTQLNATGNALGYSTYLGSGQRGDDTARSRAVYSIGNAYVTGPGRALCTIVNSAFNSVGNGPPSNSARATPGATLLAQFSQQGPKLLGTCAVGNDRPGESVSTSADSNTNWRHAKLRSFFPSTGANGSVTSSVAVLVNAPSPGKVVTWGDNGAKRSRVGEAQRLPLHEQSSSQAKGELPVLCAFTHPTIIPTDWDRGRPG